jgi:hypothetical protein
MTVANLAASGGEIRLGRQRRERVGPRRHQAGEVGRQLDLENGARRRNHAGAIGVGDGRPRRRDGEHRFENRVCFCGSRIDMHGDISNLPPERAEAAHRSQRQQYMPTRYVAMTSGLRNNRCL